LIGKNMGKIIGILVVCLIVGLLVWVFPGNGDIYEDVVVTDFKHNTFLESSITTVKFADGDVRVCRGLPYRDKGDELLAKKSGSKLWKLKK
jgi:hypothetical protein